MKILIFAGTTEGRKLAEILSASGIECDVSVATSYGSQMMKENGNLRILCGRLDIEGMRELYRRENYCALVDATHPYAEVVSRTIRESLADKDIPYLRLSRSANENSVSGESAYEDFSDRVCFYDSVSDCAKALSETEGNILLSTGSKDLPAFTEKECIRDRIFARVIPGIESLNICGENGLSGRQIIAMQGPFSVEMNLATIRQYDIKHLVTKDSGRTGGFDEKIEAADKAGISAHIIRKPETDDAVVGMTMQEVINRISEITGRDIKRGKLNVTLAGIGCGSLPGMTVEGRNAIENADYIFGAERMINPAGEINRSAVRIPCYMAQDIIPELEKIYNAETEASGASSSEAVILFSGDTGFYSGSTKLCDALRKLPFVNVSVLPGISSVQYMASACKVSWDNAHIMSLHGKSQYEWKAEIYDSIRYNPKTLFITSGAEDIVTIRNIISEGDFDIDSIEFHAGRNLSYPDERIYEIIKGGSISDDEPEKGLYAGLIINNKCEGRILTPNLSDSEFIRDRVPMTKEDVRKLSVCKLGLHPGAVVYDIGCGTGSISVEMAGLSPDIKVYAIDCNEAALKLSAKNIEKHRRYNVTIVEGTAPEAFENLPVATHAFIGGSRGNLRSIIDRLAVINPNMRIVMNAVSLESITQMNEIIKERNISEPDIVQVAISRAKQVGNYNMMDADNPVYIFSFVLNAND